MQPANIQVTSETEKWWSKFTKQWITTCFFNQMLGMSRRIGADSWDFTLPYFTQARWQPALSKCHVT